MSLHRRPPALTHGDIFTQRGNGGGGWHPGLITAPHGTSEEPSGQPPSDSVAPQCPARGRTHTSVLSQVSAPHRRMVGSATAAREPP
jgi:hypothetical protein